MKYNNIAALRENLEQMETRQLDAMLHDELKKEMPDGQLVRLIGSILQEREKDMIPEIDDNIRQAWDQYQQTGQPVHKRPKRLSSRLVKAASLILVLIAFLMLLPQEANAKNFFERFMDWTEDIFSLTSPSENQGRDSDYVFRTDNPGLQEVYDQVTALGVTVPVVPMWLPEGYDLVDCTIDSTPTEKYLLAAFSDGNGNLLYQIDVYSDNVTHKYYKEDLGVQTYEVNSTVFTVMQNQNLWIVIWTIDNIECSLGIDCPEEILFGILDSIYTMEEP